MKTRITATLSVLAVLAGGVLVGHANPLSYDDNVMIYNGTVRAQLLATQVRNDSALEKSSESSSSLPWASVFKRNFTLHSLGVLDCMGNSVYMPYGTYRDPQTRRTERIYWFAGGPFACEAYPFPKNLVSFPTDDRGRNWSQRAYQSYGNNLHRGHSYGGGGGSASYEPRINFGFDLLGPLRWFSGREAFPPRGALSKLGLVFEDTNNSGNRDYESFLARTLSGPGFAYLYNDSGSTCESWSAPGCILNIDMTLSQSSFDGGSYVDGYDFACLNTSITYRINPSLTTASNVFNPIIQASGSGSKTTYPGSLAYGTEVAQGSLESMGYRFASEQDLFYFIFITILGLDPST